jgi:hypothetical protein
MVDSDIAGTPGTVVPDRVWTRVHARLWEEKERRERERLGGLTPLSAADAVTEVAYAEGIRDGHRAAASPQEEGGGAALDIYGRFAAAPAPAGVRVDREALAAVLQHHLPVKAPNGGPVLCICDVTKTYDGPVGHRLHVADALLAGSLAPLLGSPEQPDA